MEENSSLNQSWDWDIIILSIAVCLKGTDNMLGTTEAIQYSSRTKFRLMIALNFGFAMGFGAVWPMHFMGMTALIVNSKIKYDLILNVISALLCTIGGFLGMYFMTVEIIKKKHIMMCGFFLGIGVISMHYTGMASMRCVDMSYN